MYSASSTQAGVTDVYEKDVEEKVSEYKSKTSRQKYAKSDPYQKFKQAIYVSVHDRLLVIIS